jgi:hypothetical protein
LKNDLQEKYKGLCDDTTSVTDYLFGDDVKGKIRDGCRVQHRNEGGEVSQ